MSTGYLPLNDQLFSYLLNNSLRESALQKQLRLETASIPEGGMQISPEQGQFMQFLIKLLGARKTLEVGVFTGYSSLCTALALPDDGQIIACDVSEKWTSIARRYWAEAGVAHKIDLRLAPATTTLDALLADGQAETFDFAFIDADKENYLHYYERALQLVRKGGLIAIDNTLWYGKVADESVQDVDTIAIRELNKALHHDDRIFLSLTQIGDGVTLAIKLID
ncbi:MAG: class I SAM-dependent methyltransferase [Acidobacteria bacterium]|nr:class I SAM-dependent methyltransferase [Acidobacteriota bacterium]